MVKTKLSVERRDKIHSFMMATWEGKQESVRNTEEFSKLLTLINQEIRKKYPEKDMEVLRKYKLTRQDSYVKLHCDTRIQGTNGVLFLDTDFKDVPEDKAYGLVLVVDKPVMMAYDIVEKLFDKYTKTRNEKAAKFREFLNSCRYVEDVMEYVDLPISLRPIKGTAIMAINPEVLKTIKKEFKNG